VTGYQLEVVLVIGSICAMIVLCTVANAWARRAEHRAAEARERRVLAEVDLEASRPTEPEESP
jgi:hypothetical protein